MLEGDPAVGIEEVSAVVAVAGVQRVAEIEEPDPLTVSVVADSLAVELVVHQVAAAEEVQVAVAAAVVVMGDLEVGGVLDVVVVVVVVVDLEPVVSWAFAAVAVVPVTGQIVVVVVVE